MTIMGLNKWNGLLVLLLWICKRDKRLAGGNRTPIFGSIMPLYHFNIEDGVAYPDLEGAHCLDLEAARTEAVRRSGQLLHDNAVSFWGGRGWKLTGAGELVSDES